MNLERSWKDTYQVKDSGFKFEIRVTDKVPVVDLSYGFFITYRDKDFSTEFYDLFDSWNNLYSGLDECIKLETSTGYTARSEESSIRIKDCVTLSNIAPGIDYGGIIKLKERCLDAILLRSRTIEDTAETDEKEIERF